MTERDEEIVNETAPSVDAAETAQPDESVPSGRKLPRMAGRFPYPGKPERREFLVKVSLFSAGTVAYAKPAIAMARSAPGMSPGGEFTVALSGTGVITSACGTSTLSFNSDITYSPTATTITFSNVTTTGTLVSGYDVGPVQIQSSAPFAGTISGSTFSASGSLLYSDNFNTDLVVPATFDGTIDAGGLIQTLNHSGTGSGFCPSTGVLAIQVAF